LRCFEMTEKELGVGDEAPGFCLPDQDGEEVCLEDYRGMWVVLYFYPRDGTRSCTMEALAFTAAREELEEMGVAILGVSPDSPKSHAIFMEKNGLGVTLLSDEGHGVLERYGVWQLKKMYGREHLGVVRSTFLIDQEGRIAHVWPRVRVKSHVEAVREKLSELKAR